MARTQLFGAVTRALKQAGVGPAPRALSRRSFLRSGGVVMSLPLLDAMVPALAAAAATSSPTAPGAKPRRMLAVCNNLGLVPEYFFPKEPGRDYQPSPCLEMLADHKDDFTVFSGVWHPDVDGGHPADNCFLTAAPRPPRRGQPAPPAKTVADLNGLRICVQGGSPAQKVLAEGLKARGLSYQPIVKDDRQQALEA